MNLHESIELRGTARIAEPRLNSMASAVTLYSVGVNSATAFNSLRAITVSNALLGSWSQKAGNFMMA